MEGKLDVTRQRVSRSYMISSASRDKRKVAGTYLHAISKQQNRCRKMLTEHDPARAHPWAGIQALVSSCAVLCAEDGANHRSAIQVNKVHDSRCAPCVSLFR